MRFYVSASFHFRVNDFCLINGRLRKLSDMR
jgi:hypothetical protein